VSITACGRDVDRVGFGDDVAAAAGLVAYDDHGRPAFCGDALADPITGLTAAVRALTAARGSLVDVSMAAVVAGTLDPGAPATGAAGPTGAPGNTGTPVPTARAGRTGWVLDTAEGAIPVYPPRARTPSGQAADSGAHTARILRELGLD
jgi:hypothetical protein